MFNLYPYKNLNDFNLDYILKTLKQLKETVETFIATETVTFADPILWNISIQYAKNTIVLSNSGDAYLSKQAVPVNIQLDNPDYWQEIFNFADYVRTANSNLTFNIEQNTTRATHAYIVDAWLLWDDVLYKVTSAIAVDDLLVVGTNIVHFTVEDFIKAFMTWATNTIQQYKNDIDASELLYRQQLAGDIANTTASLQAQLDLAIAGATVDSEVINARLGADGVTYATLGDAIRTQITNIVTPMVNTSFVSDDMTVNSIIKELYLVSQIDIAQITKVRIYNGQGGNYGFKFFDSNNTQKLDVTYPTKPKGIKQLSNAKVVFGDVGIINASYKDFNITLKDSVYDIGLMPILSNATDYLVENGFMAFTNREIYPYIKECYVPSNLDLSDVNKIRIYNGYASLYGFKLYHDSTQRLDFTFAAIPSAPIQKGIAYAVFNDLGSLPSTYQDFETEVTPCITNIYTMPEIYAYFADAALDSRVTMIENAMGQSVQGFSNTPTGGQILYEADSKSVSDFIVNAVSYNDGTIIACRSDGTVVKIALDGTETIMLTIGGVGPFDWRCCYMDSRENVYVSPHASYGNMTMTDRGLYRLIKGGVSFAKVISLYDPTSPVPTEAESNDDTIWTMCEDEKGNLYAGVYSHTVHDNPAIYKSTDGGVIWTYYHNFKTAGDTPHGKHIHSIIFSKWKNALYVIVGEINTIFKSTDGAYSWTNLHITLTTKGSAMLATPSGIIIGSDGAYNCEIDLLLNDDSSHVNVFKGLANTVFAIRCSDVTGMVYAFTKIDSAVNSLLYYPPVEALTDPDEIDTWHNNVGDEIYNNWLAYHDSVQVSFPSDCIRPQHYAILVSRNGGLSWDVLKLFSSSSEYANGCWTTGYFFNGECLTGRMVNHDMVAPVVVSEGRHKYIASGVDLDGEIFIRTNSNDIVTPI